MLRDIERGKDPQVQAVLGNITQIRPDILVIQRFDWDQQNLALTAFQQALKTAGWPLPHAYAPRPNTGVQTGFDVDGNGHLNDGADAQGFGRFTGNRALAILSRHPIRYEEISNYSNKLWADLPDNKSTDPAPLAAVQRLSSVAHVRVPVEVDGTPFHLLTFHATAPVFDDPDDRNGRRNADEILLGLQMVHDVPTGHPFAIAAVTNSDPVDGDSVAGAMAPLLTSPLLQDTQPRSIGAQNAADTDHKGDPALDTVDWPDGRPGNLRVSYVLPSADVTVKTSGVHWPEGVDTTHSRHRIVWVDVVLP